MCISSDLLQARAEDHFYAMIGAISKDKTSTTEKLQPCEAFMRVCEMKGDFSFIFSAAKREATPLRRWRPVVGDLPSILPFHCFGSRQPGQLSDAGLLPDEIFVVRPGPPQGGAVRLVQQWLDAIRDDHSHPQNDFERASYFVLKRLGFQGSTTWVPTSSGFFFHLRISQTHKMSPSWRVYHSHGN